MGFEITYVKRQNDKLFKDLESKLNVTNCQNYIPLYNHFFKLNETNYNHINLNNELYVSKIKDKAEDLPNTYICELKNASSSNNSVVKEVFFKFSPLLDPSKYMTGKYDIENPNLLTPPNFTGENCHEKIIGIHNSAYVDGFFSYLTSKLLHKHGFIHGIDFYGAYIGIKNDFLYDVIDEIDYLIESNFFNKNRNILFSIDETLESKLFEVDTRNCKKRLLINNDNDGNSNSNEFITLDDITSLDELDQLFIQDSNTNLDAVMTEINNDYNEAVETSKINKTGTSSNSSFCSSRSSNTNYDDNDKLEQSSNSGEDDVDLQVEELNLNDNKNKQDKCEKNTNENTNENENNNENYQGTRSKIFNEMGDLLNPTEEKIENIQVIDITTFKGEGLPSVKPYMNASSKIIDDNGLNVDYGSYKDNFPYESSYMKTINSENKTSSITNVPIRKDKIKSGVSKVILPDGVKEYIEDFSYFRRAVNITKDTIETRDKILLVPNERVIPQADMIRNVLPDEIVFKTKPDLDNFAKTRNSVLVGNVDKRAIFYETSKKIDESKNLFNLN